MVPEGFAPVVIRMSVSAMSCFRMLLFLRHSTGIIFPSLEPQRFDEYFQYAVEMGYEAEKEYDYSSDGQDGDGFNERDGDVRQNRGYREGENNERHHREDGPDVY